MKHTLRHASEYLDESLRKQNKQSPNLPLSLLALPFKQYTVFRSLVIPFKNDIAVIDWIIVRNDCVFILGAFIEPDDPKQMTTCIHYQFNKLKEKAQCLSDLLAQVNYKGSIFPILVSLKVLTVKPHQDQVVLHISQVSPYLLKFMPEKRVMYPGLAIDLMRQLQKAMRSPGKRRGMSHYQLSNLQHYHWIKDFKPARVISCQRDFEFTPAKQPQAHAREEK